MSKRKGLLGVKALVHDAVDATVGLVRQGHESASRSINAVGEAVGVAGPVRTIESVRMGATHGILSTITVVNRSIETVSNAAIELAAPSGCESSATALPLRDDVLLGGEWWSDALVGGLNGSVGDHLARRDNPLEAEMCLRIGDRYFVPGRCDANAFEELESIAVFVHGLAATEWSWVYGAERSWGDPSVSFGTRLHADFGISPVYVRYNSGRTIAANGEALADLLADLTERAPNLRSIVIFGHSMGGLLTREACRTARDRDERWTELVRHVFYLGSPHSGAPLARIARSASGVLGAVDLPATQIIARIIDGRSEGIKDLADGLDGALSPGKARHTFISGTITDDPDHPAARILGDLLVQRKSAEGEAISSRTIDVSREHRGRVLHHQVQNHPTVYDVIHNALTDEQR